MHRISTQRLNPPRGWRPRRQAAKPGRPGSPRAFQAIDAQAARQQAAAHRHCKTTQKPGSGQAPKAVEPAQPALRGPAHSELRKGA